MRKFQPLAAIIVAATLPALAGTVMEHAPRARPAQPSPIASESTTQKVTPPVKGGLLNVPVTQLQAKAAARDTNRKIARGEIRPQKDED